MAQTNRMHCLHAEKEEEEDTDSSHLHQDHVHTMTAAATWTTTLDAIGSSTDAPEMDKMLDGHRRSRPGGRDGDVREDSHVRVVG